MTIHELDKHLFEEADKIMENLHDHNLTYGNLKQLKSIATIQLWLRHTDIKTHFAKGKKQDVPTEPIETSGSYLNQLPETMEKLLNQH